MPDALRCLGQRCLVHQLLPAFKALLSLFSGGLGCQMLYGAWGNVAWCISFCLLLPAFKALLSLFCGRAWLPDALRCLGQRCLVHQLLPASKALLSLFSGGLGCQMLYGALGQRCLVHQILPAFKALLSLFSGGLGCQMLYGAWGNVAWCISFCLLWPFSFCFSFVFLFFLYLLIFLFIAFPCLFGLFLPTFGPR